MLIFHILLWFSLMLSNLIGHLEGLHKLVGWVLYIYTSVVYQLNKTRYQWPVLFPSSWIIQSWKIQGFAGFDSLTGSKALMRVFFFFARQSCLYFRYHVSRRFTCAKKTRPPLGVHSPHNRSELKACHVLGIPDGSHLHVIKTRGSHSSVFTSASQSWGSWKRIRTKAFSSLVITDNNNW